MLRKSIDTVGSAVLLGVTSPLFIVVGLAVWMTDFGPVFYRQTRAGLFGRPFDLIKFRSMAVNSRPTDSLQEIGKADPLVTTIGRFIRRTKIDELPQLINVLRGEMSWIGPRPTVPSQVEAYTPFQRRRLEVLPGLTGWAQVNGGAEISWEDRIMLEVWYIEHRSLLLDLKIIRKTLTVIVLGHKPNEQAIEHARRFAEQERNARTQNPLPAMSFGQDSNSSGKNPSIQVSMYSDKERAS
jgi:lipopolysaccharide/colanic/teichoic acid biosynthesis glycosyltransferase